LCFNAPVQATLAQASTKEGRFTSQLAAVSSHKGKIITYIGKLSSLRCTVIDVVARTRAATVDFPLRFHLAHPEPGSRTHLGVDKAMRGVCEIVAMVQWLVGRVE
jgi:hypothetical protein